MTTRPPPNTPKELSWWERRTVTQQAGLALLAVLLLFAVVFYGFALLYVRPFRVWPWSAKDHPSLYDLTRNAATVAALLGGAVAIAVALRRQRSTERTVELAEETAQIAQITANITAQAYGLDQDRAAREEIDRLRDRYTTISGQLGHDAAPVRLAGVYAMAALADDWLKRRTSAFPVVSKRENGNHEAQVCIDVLCAYVRTPRHEATEEGHLADTRVRETITRVIAAHLQAGAVSLWSGKTFDFTGSTFEGTHTFDRAQFNEGCQVTFNGAQFNEGSRVTFTRAEFNEGCQVTFNNAGFNKGCQVTFIADFNMGCQVTFEDADFYQDCLVDIRDAEFKGGWVTFGFTGSNGTDSPSGPWNGDRPPLRWPQLK